MTSQSLRFQGEFLDRRFQSNGGSSGSKSKFAQIQSLNLEADALNLLTRANINILLGNLDTANDLVHRTEINAAHLPEIESKCATLKEAIAEKRLTIVQAPLFNEQDLDQVDASPSSTRFETKATDDEVRKESPQTIIPFEHEYKANSSDLPFEQIVDNDTQNSGKDELFEQLMADVQNKFESDSNVPPPGISTMPSPLVLGSYQEPETTHEPGLTSGGHLQTTPSTSPKAEPDSPPGPMKDLLMKLKTAKPRARTLTSTTKPPISLLDTTLTPVPDQKTSTSTSARTPITPSSSLPNGPNLSKSDTASHPTPLPIPSIAELTSRLNPKSQALLLASRPLTSASPVAPVPAPPALDPSPHEPNPIPPHPPQLDIIADTDPNLIRISDTKSLPKLITSPEVGDLVEQKLHRAAVDLNNESESVAEVSALTSPTRSKTEPVLHSPLREMRSAEDDWA